LFPYIVSIVFTGIIQSLGYLSAQRADRLEITLAPADAHRVLGDMELGDSIAVDGVCLTVEAIANRGFLADVSPETLQRTTLGRAKERRTAVNIETSLRVGGKVGGHFVSGHVDGVGQLLSNEQTDNAWLLSFGAVGNLQKQWQQYLAPYLVPKGSIAVNGISLTVADCGEDWFNVAVIPHTYSETNLQLLQPGDWVNLEGDILGKYAARFLSRGQAMGQTKDIDLAFLHEHGYS
jgi:riboflavin synthase